MAITLSKIRLDLFASESLKTSTIGILTLRNKADTILFFISLFNFCQIKQTQNMKAYVVNRDFKIRDATAVRRDRK